MPAIDEHRHSKDAAKMKAYRFYFVTGQNKLLGPSVRYDCADDAAALLRAGALAGDAPMYSASVEIWDLNRLVGRVPLNQPATQA